MDGSGSTDFFRSMAESIPQLVWTTRPDGYHEYFNQRWLRYTGLNLSDAIGDGWSRILHPADYQRCLTMWSKALSTASMYEIEVRLRRFDGAFRWYLGRATPVKDQLGNVVQWFGTCTDIHAQKSLSLDRDNLLDALRMVSSNPLIGAIRALELLANKELGELNEQQVDMVRRVIDSNKAMTVLLRNLKDANETVLCSSAEVIENAPVGIVILDADLNVSDINSALAAMICRDREQLLDKPLADILPPEAFQTGAFALKNGEPWQILRQAVTIYDNGSEMTRNWDMSFWSITTEEGKIKGAVLQIIDCTDKPGVTDIRPS